MPAEGTTYSYLCRVAGNIVLSHVAYELHIAVIRIETLWNVSLFLFAPAPCHRFVLNFFLSYDAC